MDTLALPVSESFDSDTGLNWQTMAKLAAHDLFPHLTDQSQYILQRDFIADFQSAEENFISLTGLKVRDADAVSFFEKADSDLINDIHMSIAVPFEAAPADCRLIIDTERAVSFTITVFGMVYPENSGLQINNSAIRCSLRQRRESIGTGRMICVLKQQLIL